MNLSKIQIQINTDDMSDSDLDKACDMLDELKTEIEQLVLQSLSEFPGLKVEIS